MLVNPDREVSHLPKHSEGVHALLGGLFFLKTLYPLKDSKTLIRRYVIPHQQDGAILIAVFSAVKLHVVRAVVIIIHGISQAELCRPCKVDLWE